MLKPQIMTYITTQIYEMAQKAKLSTIYYSL